MNEFILFVSSSYEVRKVWIDGESFLGSSRKRVEEMGSVELVGWLGIGDFLLLNGKERI